MSKDDELKDGLYDELDEQIIEALTVDPRVQWFTKQRRAIRKLIEDREPDLKRLKLKARMEQIMQDFSTYSVELDVDESELIRIREAQLQELWNE